MADRWSRVQVNIQSYLKPLLLIVLCGGLVQCGNQGKKSDLPGGQWQSKMQEMGQALIKLYPNLVSREKFNAPENRYRIQQDVKRLASLAHNVNKQRAKPKVKKLDRDPLVSVLANTMDREMHWAVDALEAGKIDSARAILINAASMCVQCHSRGSWGPHFVDWEKNKAFLELKPLAKAQLLAAVRRYDLAIVHLKAILADKQQASNESYEWTKAANLALNVAVRAQQDPGKAEKIVAIILANEDLPSFHRRNAKDWEQAVWLWKKEKPRKKESLLKKAERILKEARKKEDYWGDRSSYIHYLRASALLHDFLRTKASREDQARALFLLAQCSEVVAEMGIGETNELYYKFCIKRFPHSKTALGCYDRLEQNVLLDYSGRGRSSFGFPSGIMMRLRAWRNLATPVEKKSDFGKEMFKRQ